MPLTFTDWHSRIQEAIQAAIRDASLPKLDSEDVRIETGYQMNSSGRRGVFLSKSTERPLSGTMGLNETSYPVVVVLMEGGGGTAERSNPHVAQWRQDIIDIFRDRREPVVTYLTEVDPAEISIVICRVDFGSNYLDKYWRDAWDANHFVIWVTARTARPEQGSTTT